MDKSPKQPEIYTITKQSLHDAILRGWPSMSPRTVGQTMNIRADDVYSQYVQAMDLQDLFEKAANWISRIQATVLHNHHQQILINEEIHNTLIKAIFGSNMIEHVGLGYDITAQLCKRNFAGEDVTQIPLIELYPQQPNLKDMSTQDAIRHRNEIVQHAKAFQHMIHCFVTEEQDLSEELIKNTHRILTTGIPIITRNGPDIPPQDYGGIYRTVVVGAGGCNFTVPKFVPKKMKEMCSNLKRELATADDKKSIDPFSIAAKYSLEFVQIHPFQDGNGRLCRMILNTILCRYAGVIVPIGEHDEERREYLAIKRRSSETMDGHGEYATFVLRRAIPRLREMKKKLAGKHEGTTRK
ncbi:fido domain-containing protein [Annulohypoxylon bovei var. microspora]|nr:fido domain-containing protein [Annulohypoxylon bovei var. microspora]